LLSVNANNISAGTPQFVVGSSTATNLIVANNGNVGIGTFSPNRKLSLYGGAGLDTYQEIRSDNGNTPGLLFRTSTAGVDNSGWNLFINGADSNKFSLYDAMNARTLMTATQSGFLGVGTTSPTYQLTVASSTSSQLALSAGADLAEWAFRNAGGNLYIATTTINGNATTSVSAIEIAGGGFGTTTLRGLNIAGQATTTANVGINITTGCYAINGTCISGGGASGTVGSGVFGQLAFYGANGTAVSGTSTITIATTTNSGRVGIATSTNLNATLTLQGASGLDILRIATSTSGSNVITISEWGGFVQKVSSSTALSVQMASGTPVFEVDTTNSNSNAGIDITAATGQTANLLNMYSSGGTFLSGFTAAGGLFMNVSSSTAINMYDGSGNASFVVNSTAADVGIGTSTLAYDFTVQGNQSANYIARIDNANTGTDADGLLISLGVANGSRTTSNYFIGFADGSKTVAGKIQGGASAVAYTTSAADLAEYFRVSNLNDLPKQGEIVMLDTTKDKTVKRAEVGNQIEPLGIVSTNPGFIGNGPICLANDNDCDHNYMKYNSLVAIAGQVPVRVSLENGPIAIGDYLTLSSITPGVATKLVGSGYVVGVAISEATTTDFVSNDPHATTTLTTNQYTDTCFNSTNKYNG
jgi:hypothetical protein